MLRCTFEERSTLWMTVPLIYGTREIVARQREVKHERDTEKLSTLHAKEIRVRLALRDVESAGKISCYIGVSNFTFKERQRFAVSNFSFS